MRKITAKISQLKIKLDKADIVFIALISVPTLVKIYVAYLSQPFGIQYEIVSNISFGAWVAGIWRPEQILSRSGTGVQFLLPYIISWALRFDWGLRPVLFFCVLSNAAAVLAIYKLAFEFWDKKTALIACGLLSLNWHFWWWSNTLLPEIPAVASITIALLFFYLGVQGKRTFYLWLAGTFYAVGFLFKYTAGAMLFVFLTFLIMKFTLRNRKEIDFLKSLGHVLAFFTLVICAWGFYNVSVLHIGAFQPILGNAQMNRVGNDLGSFYQRILFYAYKTPTVLSLLVSMFSILGAITAIKHRSYGDVLTLSWIVTFFLGSSILIPSSHDQYMTIWTPALVLLAARGISEFDYSLKQRLGKRQVIKTILIVIPILTLFSTYCIDPIPLLNIGIVDGSFQIELRALRVAHERILQAATSSVIRADLVELLREIQSYNLTPIYHFEEAVLLLSFLAPLITSLILKLRGRKKSPQFYFFSVLFFLTDLIRRLVFATTLFPLRLLLGKKKVSLIWHKLQRFKIDLIDLIKVDVEDLRLEVLQGAGKVITDNKIGRIITKSFKTHRLKDLTKAYVYAWKKF